MPKPFRKLSPDEFLTELQAFARNSPGVIDAVHMHHTWRPNHSQWHGLDSVEAIWRFHTGQNRWLDIGQHITIDPEGFLWTGRDWSNPPCSAPGHNGTRARHPFMFELAGDFDNGNDSFSGPQRETALAVSAGVQHAFGLEPSTLRFHNQMGPKTCPGSSISYDEILEAVRARSAGPTRSSCALDEESLRGHLVHLTRGRLSKLGSFRTAESDLDDLFAHRLPAWASAHPSRPVRLLLWALSGLDSESESLDYARRMASFWKNAGVYPVFFLWETGLLETIRHLLGRRDKILEDRWDGSLSMAAERLVRRGGGLRKWQEMKDQAAASVKPETGGAWQFARRLASFRNPALELHAAGHSGGAVFLSQFIPAARRLGLASFRTAHFLAPALRTDIFDARLRPLLGAGIDHLTLYSMTRDAELADPCSRTYRRSFLHLVSRALEPQFAAPILGLDESLRADLRLAATFGLAGTSSPLADVVWSRSDACAARTHTAFPEDEATLDTILNRITEPASTSLRLPEAA